MGTLQPPLTPELRLAQEQKERYDKITRNLAIGGVVLCPLIVLMPPRKLDLYTLSLGFGFYWSADHLSATYTGRSIIETVGSKLLRSPVSSMPTERAREAQQLLKEKDDIEKGKLALREGGKKKEERDILRRIWMGDETEGWKERRMEEERRAHEEGRSYASIIMEQISEAFNLGKKDGEEGKSNEEKKP
ncbi:hypothetical protein BDV95DRAFT_586545 [Massariosphaeria phaeospora]|uniref:Uncharacterized protein n=1 Tax=Massariosphaeria phaeospora TaxID=100035 RepID=A0A7C8HYV4_9PLEO|nr:hypothetical protein BDV95DRAFT_586545 [Massariosphaeria phaeospora]